MTEGSIDDLPSCTDAEMKKAMRNGKKVVQSGNGLLVTSYHWKGKIYVASVEPLNDN
jgi:hypothetical protein